MNCRELLDIWEESSDSERDQLSVLGISYAMTFSYHQSTGALSNDKGVLIGEGYSGFGQWKNDPASEALEDRGPIPQGLYLAGQPRQGTHMGPDAIPLIPDDATRARILAMGREPDSFYCHGDNADHDASEGCIIQPRAARLQLPGNWVEVLA